MHMYERGLGRNAVGIVVIWTVPWFPAYLWTLPMLHCNVWRFPWTVALQCGVHGCLRRADRSQPHHQHRPAPRDDIAQRVRGMVAGAAPPAALIEGMAAIGFEIAHVYGLTEVYGTTSVAVKRPS
jgi:fatty-acyl-CoA synthase